MTSSSAAGGSWRSSAGSRGRTGRRLEKQLRSSPMRHVNRFPLSYDRRYLHPHVCFACQKSFRRYVAPPPAGPRKCPDCGGPTVALNRKFKAPQRGDDKQWAKVRYLVEHGYLFRSVVDDSGGKERYPSTLAEAREFVLRRKASAEKQRFERARNDRKRARKRAASRRTR